MAKIVYVCNCSNQEFYECGGLGCSSCPDCYAINADRISGEAAKDFVPSNIENVFHYEYGGNSNV